MNEASVADMVSVVIPTYNRAALVGDALESVRKQTYRPIEIIVVDDGSADNTSEVVQSFAQEAVGDIDVRYVRQENQGASSARNRGLLECRGEFIQFLDSDDTLHPDKLSAQVAVMREAAEVLYVFSARERIDAASGQVLWPWPADFQADHNSVMNRMLHNDVRSCTPLCTINGLYRRALCRQLGPWDESLKVMEDSEYNMRMLVLNVPMRYVPHVHAWGRRHGEEHLSDGTGNVESIAARRAGWGKVQRMLGKAEMLTARRNNLLARMYYHLARPAFIAGSTELGFGLLGDGLAVCPFSGTRLKLRLVKILYVTLGTRCANALLGLKMRLGASRKAQEKRGAPSP